MILDTIADSITYVKNMRGIGLTGCLVSLLSSVTRYENEKLVGDVMDLVNGKDHERVTFMDGLIRTLSYESKTAKFSSRALLGRRRS